MSQTVASPDTRAPFPLRYLTEGTVPVQRRPPHSGNQNVPEYTDPYVLAPFVLPSRRSKLTSPPALGG